MFPELNGVRPVPLMQRGLVMVTEQRVNDWIRLQMSLQPPQGWGCDEAHHHLHSTYCVHQIKNQDPARERAAGLGLGFR